MPDIRDTAGPPVGIDEDTVHAPGADEVAAAAARAREVAAELRNREVLEARHDAEERAHQLATWQQEADPASEQTADASDDEAVAGSGYADV